jgi:hypothetical protein
MTVDPLQAKAESERVITSLGGKTLEWLPWLDRTEPRESEEVASRALAVHAMVEVHFGAPTAVISKWIQENGLLPALRREPGVLGAEYQAE